MGKASSAKKVARAARTGGGRTRRSRGASWAWPAAMTMVAVIGVVLIVISRKDLSSAAGTRPTTSDHWHAGYGFDICGKFQPDLPQPAKLLGIHTHGDGVVHVEPQNSKDTGKGATLGRWVSGQTGLKVTKDTIKLPGGKTYKNGDKCGKKPAIVQASVNGKAFNGDPGDIRIKDGGVITVAFLPKGDKVPDPPNVKEKIARAASGATEPGAQQQQQQPPLSVPPPVPGTAPGATTPSSVPPATTPTSRPASPAP